MNKRQRKKIMKRFQQRERMPKKLVIVGARAFADKVRRHFDGIPILGRAVGLAAGAAAGQAALREYVFANRDLFPGIFRPPSAILARAAVPALHDQNGHEIP